MTIAETPADRCTNGMLFRIFLRDTYYPKHQGEIIDTLYNNIPDAMDIDNTDTSTYRVKCKNRKSSTVFDYATQIENALLSIVTRQEVITQVHNSTMTDYDKSRVALVYNQLCTDAHLSCYIKLMYNVTLMNMNATSKLLTVLF